MTARVLVVDDIPANVKLLETHLLAEYFDVLTAENGLSALEICDKTQVDLILLDIMMPGIDGFEVCRRLKANPKTTHIPVVMVTALDQPEDRVEGLKCGADDFLTKPVNNMQLMARVKSLLRLKMLTDELRVRAGNNLVIDDVDEKPLNKSGIDEKGMTLLVDGRVNSQDRITRAISGIADVDIISDAETALFHAGENPYELIIINDNLPGVDPLRICSQLRSREITRFVPILVILQTGDEPKVVRALDIGVNDYILQPLDPNELYARSLTQIKRSRFSEKLRESLNKSVELAVVDPLTGLNNRHFLDAYMGKLIARAKRRNTPISMLITDIDKFKNVNDTHGHDAGDEILREFARRLRASVRGADLACRFGGEEFVVLMPDTTAEMAAQIAERLRAAIETSAFNLPGDTGQLELTTSVGVTNYDPEQDSSETLIKRADDALYKAKSDGRNRVVLQTVA
ncbi:PleD family two-component system response regulator [Lentilitoribacter sp. EG35]|uniref:PleD family two-component system response regulator n=1 Tax=Lentilitoribacter sp. EG35 TaxID=3234192 RepID=UPI0034615F52